MSCGMETNEEMLMLLQAECKHCRARLDTAGKAPGDALMCGCGALVFVVETNAAPAAVKPRRVPI